MKKRPISWHKSMTLDQMLDPTYNDQWTPETEHSDSTYTVPGLYSIMWQGSLYILLQPYDNEGFPAVQALASRAVVPEFRGRIDIPNQFPGHQQPDDRLVMKKDVTNAVKEIAAVGTPEALEAAADIKQQWRPGWYLAKFAFSKNAYWIDDDSAARSGIEAALDRWRGK
jgi:hypothetical protein